MMYKEGCLPEDMNKFIFITIPNVSGTTKCGEASDDKFDELRYKHYTSNTDVYEISAVKYGFMIIWGKRNAIYALRRMVERFIEKQIDEYTCLMDYSKALTRWNTNIWFDSYNLLMLMNNIKSCWLIYAGINKKQWEISKTLDIKQGVRQGKKFMKLVQYDHNNNNNNTYLYSEISS